MTAVKVSVGRPLEGGRLEPQYDSESDVLAVTSEIPRDWCHGVDIDGNIVFDLDASCSLANIDVHVGRRLWERGEVRQWPDKPPVGTLVFKKETVRQKSLNAPLRFIYDGQQGILNIVIGSKRPERELELSANCIALLSGSELVGFLVRRF